MRDQYSNKLIKSPFTGVFTLDSKSNTQYCIKKGKLEDIKEIYERRCFDEEYKDTLTFDYTDTIGGLLIFNYRSRDSHADIHIGSKDKSIGQKNIVVTQPKNLTQNYSYYDDVIQSLMNGVTDGIKQGHFMQETALSEQEAKKWIQQALKQAGQESSEAFKNIASNKYKKVTRLDFLQMLEVAMDAKSSTGSRREYKDLKPQEQELVGKIFGNNYTWKDNF